jgi:hypothetical protein
VIVGKGLNAIKFELACNALAHEGAPQQLRMS